MRALEAFLADYHARRVVFFAGAGVSHDSGAAMPGPVLAASAAAFLPDDPEFAAEIAQVLQGDDLTGAGFAGIQPEIFYEHLLSLTDDPRVLGLWRILSPIWLASQGAALTPNANHLALVRYAAQSGTPLFTTNFDTLFEDAARQLGFGVDVRTPGRPPVPGRSAEVQLFKLHGSIVLDGQERLDTLHTTMQSITAVRTDMMDEIQRAQVGRSLCFIGYSGCDIDYFPVIAGLSLDRAPFWFNPRREQVVEAHAEHVGATQIAAFPAQVFAELHGFSSTAPRPNNSALIGHLRTQLPDPLTAPQKRLLLAMCLHSVGRNDAAERVLGSLLASEAGLVGADRARALLARARVLDALSAYRRSERAAQAAQQSLRPASRSRHAQPAPFAALRARALYHREMARQQQIGPSLGYAIAGLRWRPRYLDMVLSLLSGLAVLLRLRRMQAKRQADPHPGPDAIRADHALNDHALLMIGRIIAVAEMLRLLRIAPVRRACARVVSAVLGAAHATGDYFVYAGARKYQRRLEGADEPDHASQTYGLLRDPLNYAIVRRDLGARRIEDGDLASAGREFEASAAAALACGSRATALKAYAGLARCRPLASSEMAAFVAAGEQIEGAGYERYVRKKLRPWSGAPGVVSARS